MIDDFIAKVNSIRDTFGNPIDFKTGDSTAIGEPIYSPIDYRIKSMHCSATIDDLINDLMQIRQYYGKNMPIDAIIIEDDHLKHFVPSVMRVTDKVQIILDPVENEQ